MVRIQELEKYLRNELRRPKDNPVNQCGRLTSNAEIILEEDFGLKFERRQITLSNSTGKAQHIALFVPGSEFEDITSNVTIIVDVTYNQFTEERYKNNDVNVSLGSNLKPVAVLKPTDENYNAYKNNPWVFRKI